MEPHGDERAPERNDLWIASRAVQTHQEQQLSKKKTHAKVQVQGTQLDRAGILVSLQMFVTDVDVWKSGEGFKLKKDKINIVSGSSPIWVYATADMILDSNALDRRNCV